MITKPFWDHLSLIMFIELMTIFITCKDWIGSVRTDFAIDVSLGLRELMFELTFLE
jgi:hypothetical protein